MKDRVRLEGLELMAQIGVYPHERGVRQRLVVDLELETDVRPAAASDDLAQALDYDRAAAVCREVVAEGHVALIETVAERMSGRLLGAFPAVSRVGVRVCKPGAVPDARNVGVEIWRER